MVLDVEPGGRDFFVADFGVVVALELLLFQALFAFLLLDGALPDLLLDDGLDVVFVRLQGVRLEVPDPFVLLHYLQGLFRAFVQEGLLGLDFAFSACPPGPGQFFLGEFEHALPAFVLGLFFEVGQVVIFFYFFQFLGGGLVDVIVHNFVFGVVLGRSPVLQVESFVFALGVGEVFVPGGFGVGLSGTISGGFGLGLSGAVLGFESYFVVRVVEGVVVCVAGALVPGLDGDDVGVFS